MKYLPLLILASGIATTTQAKSWRVNNNPGVVANANVFTSLAAVNSSPNVNPGDTVYIEPSASSYGSQTLAKRLVIIGPGYYLDPAHATLPGNGGLQAGTQEAIFTSITFDPGSEGSKAMGISIGSIWIDAVNNLTFERCRITSQVNFYDKVTSNITIRKCFFEGGVITRQGGATTSNFVFENNLCTSFYISFGGFVGSGNIIRNNTFHNINSAIILSNAYFVNNIVDYNGTITLTNCTIKNNIFRFNQPLPATATGNKTGVVMADVFTMTGSYDGKLRLKAGSPASGAGLTVGGITPDCGAFGATDPYVLSGIPAVPTIYTLSVPTSIPSGQATMPVTFSTRNNN